MMKLTRIIAVTSAFTILGCGTGEQTFNDRGKVAGKYQPTADSETQLQVNEAGASAPHKMNVRLKLPILLEEDQGITRKNRLNLNVIAEINDPEAGTNIVATQFTDSDFGLTLKGPSGGKSTLHRTGPIAEFEIEFTDDDGYYELTLEPFQNFALPNTAIILVDRKGPEIKGTGEFKTLIAEDGSESYYLTAEFDISDMDSATCILRDPDKNELPAETVEGNQGDKAFSMLLSSHQIEQPLEYVRLDCRDPAGNINAYQLNR